MFKGIRALLPPGPSLQCRAVGDALLIQPKGRTDQSAWRFANALARDDQHTVVVVDVPGVAPDTAADAMARALADSTGSLRLVFGSGTSAEIRRAGQRIADELGTVVVVPDGEVLPTAGGGLYIPGGHGSGWLRLRPGRPFEHDSMGFPKPRWQFSMMDRPWVTSPYAVVEPLPCGVWVRGALPDAAEDNRRRLFGRLAIDPDVMTVVLGCPGGPAVPLADVVRFWDTVMPTTRSRIRFVHFGPVALPQEGEALGQQLADALEHQVVLYTGMTDDDRAPSDPAGPSDPSGTSPNGAAPDGDERTGGRSAFVRELLYSPRGTEGAPPPALVGVREPLPGFPPVAPGVYEYAFDAVLEVVQSGLWMRPHTEPDDGDDVRRIAAAPGDRLFLYHRGTPDMAARMRALAEDALWRLGADARGDFVLRPADDPAVDTGAWYAEPIAVSDPHEAVTAAIPPTTRPAGTAPWAAPGTAATGAVGSAVDNVVGGGGGLGGGVGVGVGVGVGESVPGAVANESAAGPAAEPRHAPVAPATPFQAEVWASAAEDLSAPAPAPASASVSASVSRAVAEEPSSPRPLSGLTAELALPDGWVTSTATGSNTAEAAIPAMPSAPPVAAGPEATVTAGAAATSSGAATADGALQTATSVSADPTGNGVTGVGAPQQAAAAPVPTVTRPEASVTPLLAGRAGSGEPDASGVAGASVGGVGGGGWGVPGGVGISRSGATESGSGAHAGVGADSERGSLAGGGAGPEGPAHPATGPAAVAPAPPLPDPLPAPSGADGHPSVRRLALPLAHPTTIFPPSSDSPAPAAAGPMPPAMPSATQPAPAPRHAPVPPVAPSTSGALPAPGAAPVPPASGPSVSTSRGAVPAPGAAPGFVPPPEPTPPGTPTAVLPGAAGSPPVAPEAAAPVPVASNVGGSGSSAPVPSRASTALPPTAAGPESRVAPSVPPAAAPVPSAPYAGGPTPGSAVPPGTSTALPPAAAGLPPQRVAPGPGAVPPSVAAPLPPGLPQPVSGAPSRVPAAPGASQPAGTAPSTSGAPTPQPSGAVGPALVPPPAAPPPAAPRPVGLRLESAGVYPAAPVVAEPPPAVSELAPRMTVAATPVQPPAAQAPVGVRVQPVPKGAACAVPPERGIERERDWVRKTFRAQYDVAAGTVARVMSEVPGLRSASREKASDALIDLVAVRLYLTGNSAGVDESVRSARVGPHVPLARCVASGLRRLPSYRGAAVLGAELTDAERDWYRDGRLVTEWSFCPAFALPTADLPADLPAEPRFVIWSMTARRTGLLDAAVPDRVVFLPGTTFKVLRPAGTAGDPVLIREMAATEIGADGRVKPGRSALDDLALESLERAAAALAKATASTPAGASAKSPAGAGRAPGPRSPQPQTPPGLMATAPRPRAGAGPHAPAQGATHEGATL
ncbi:hypothetical protein AB0399_18280 [Streptomyces sp. NPDC088194]|uniref:hypothetical protein n=1 Tax=Streptomyces sp. NPDC088194 TaxID=3154931 RepID=UPI00344D8913